MRVHGCGVDFIDLKVFCIFFFHDFIIEIECYVKNNI